MTCGCRLSRSRRVPHKETRCPTHYRGTGTGHLAPWGGLSRTQAGLPRLTRSYDDRMDLEFSGEVWFWRGPSPYHFVTVPEDESAELQATSAQVTYGWGMIPVEVRIGSTRWTTSLFPKDGGYVVPLKDLVRNAERIEVGNKVTVRLAIDV